MNTYDVIVLGTGGVGSATMHHLAARGLTVLGIDRFAPGHDRGSSHGHTRIIRKAYFEHPDYVPLLDRAYALWRELQQEHGQQLYFPVGLLEAGPPTGVVVPGVLASARLHNLDIEEISTTDFSQRFPGFILAEGDRAVFEKDAGYLLVEDCVRAHAASAIRQGATLLAEAATGWNADAKSVRVTTTAGEYSAGNLIVTAGAWASGLLLDLEVPLRVVRKHLHWYQAKSEEYQAHTGCPGFFYEVDGSYFYGFPAIDDRGVKVAEHGGGGEETADPLHDPRSVDAVDRARVESFLRRYLPRASRLATDHAVCFYTVSPDEHFIVDRHAEFPQVAFAAGLSGHGFKFTSVLGEILADLVTLGKSPQPIAFLRADRFQRGNSATAT